MPKKEIKNILNNACNVCHSDLQFTFFTDDDESTYKCTSDKCGVSEIYCFGDFRINEGFIKKLEQQNGK